MRPRSAFTLIELLVVVSISAILATILLPTLSRIRESALRTTCANGLRQVAMATTGYAKGAGRTRTALQPASARCLWVRRSLWALQRRGCRITHALTV